MTVIARKTDVIELQKRMLDKGFTSRISLAEAAKIDKTKLSDILNGKCQPSADIMCKLIDCLDIPLEDAGSIFFACDLRDA